MSDQKPGDRKIFHRRSSIDRWLILSEQDGWVTVHEHHREEASAVRRVAGMAKTADVRTKL